MSESPQQAVGDGAAKETPVRRVMVVAAHPDDPEFGCGGTAATWAAAGDEVYYVVCTNGNKGSTEVTMTGDRLASLREVEQRQAAVVIGARDVVFLGFPDCELVVDLRLREAIVRMIRTYRPDVVLTHDPATLYSEQFINHPDHRAVGQATLDAIYPSARDRLIFPEHEAAGLQPHKVREVYLWGSLKPTEWIDIAPVFKQKVESIACHKTQIANIEELEARMRERAKTIGEPRGLELAEAFHKIMMMR